MDRPTKIPSKFFAVAAMIAPTPKMVRLTKIIGFRPKIELKFPRTGWKTVLVRRKDVPDQNASIAVPPSSLAMIGSATESDVASKATISVTTDSETNARISLHPGLNSSLVELLSECSEGGLDGIGLSGASIFSFDKPPDSDMAAWKIRLVGKVVEITLRV
jgi:hypothetical protein